MILSLHIQPPGTGKSRLARAIATEAGDTYTFLPITSADLLSKWVGESEKLVRALFTIARKRKPSIIFIDEIESLCSDRGGDTNVADRIKSQFLTEMQGDDDQILFIGATNLPWSLDPAFRRRFEKRIYIPLPDEESRAEMFKLYISKGINHHLTDEDFKILAEKSNGYSGADIETVVCQAAMALLKKLCKATHFKKVADKGRRNPEKQEHFWTPCSPTDRSAHKKTYKEISDDEIYDAPVTLEDIEASLSKQKPSVSAEDLGKLEKFKNDFGQDGK